MGDDVALASTHNSTGSAWKGVLGVERLLIGLVSDDWLDSDADGIGLGTVSPCSEGDGTGVGLHV